MRALTVFGKIDSLSNYIAAQKEMNRPLSLGEGLKFAKQAFYEGDSANYLLPNSFDGAFVGEYLRPNRGIVAVKIILQRCCPHLWIVRGKQPA
jgi:hypothetical protein